MDKREDFSTRFFEPKTTNETGETQNHEKERSIHETPEEIKIEAEKVDSYPEKCLWNNIWFSECDTSPDASSQESNVEDIETETLHIRIIKHFCDINAESIYPARQENKKETELSINSMDSSKYFCLPLQK